MNFLVNDLLEYLPYKKNYFSKICRELGISNHFELTLDDLKKLHALPIKNNKSYEMRIYLDSLLCKFNIKDNEAKD